VDIESLAVYYQLRESWEIIFDFPIDLVSGEGINRGTHLRLDCSQFEEAEVKILDKYLRKLEEFADSCYNSFRQISLTVHLQEEGGQDEV